MKLSGSSSLLSLQYEVVIYKRVGLIHSSPASQAACKGELDTPTRRRGWAARGRSLWSQPALRVPAWALWFQLQPQAPAVQWQAAPTALSSRLRWTVPLKVWGWLNNPPSLALLLLGRLSHWHTLGKKLTVWTCTGLENEHTIVTHDVICTPFLHISWWTHYHHVHILPHTKFILQNSVLYSTFWNIPVSSKIPLFKGVF